MTNKDLEMKLKIAQKSIQFLSASKAEDRAIIVKNLLEQEGFSSDYISKNLSAFCKSSLSTADLMELIPSLGRQSRFKQKSQQKKQQAASDVVKSASSKSDIPAFIEVQNPTEIIPVSDDESRLKSASTTDNRPSYLITREKLGL